MNAQLKIAGRSPELLGLESLLVGSFPEALMPDRRLEIANTDLEELRDGLAAVFAERLAEISAGLRSERDLAAIRFHNAAECDQRRATSVVALAESASFARRPAISASDDESRIEDWVEDGGAVRA